MAKKKRVAYLSRPFEAAGICSGCRLCEMWCSLVHNGAFNPYRARIRVVELGTGIDIPVTCQQCEDPLCREACGVEAIVYDKKLGIVVVDESKCTGCKACVGACPFGIITMDPVTHKAIKCDLCNGGDPVCVNICPSSVLKMLDDVQACEYNRKRFAALLATSDELQRPAPAGEEPVMRKMEKRG